MLVKYRSFLILLMIFCFHLGMNFYVLKQSQIAHAYDESSRIASGYDLFKAMGRMDLFVDELLSLDGGQAHPRLYEAVQAVSWKIWQYAGIEDVALTVLLTNALFLLLLLLSVYGIGTILYDDVTALLASFLVSFFPLVFGHARIAMLDFPVMSMVSLGLCMLLRTKWFTSVTYSALCGVAFALAVLTKETAVFFIAAPLAYYIGRSFWEHPEKRRVTRNVLWMATLFFLLVAPVFLNPKNFVAYSVYGIKTGMKSFPGMFYYAVEFWHMTGPLLAVLSVTFLAKYFFYCRQRDHFILLWWIVPLLVFSLSANKTLRFLMPIAPAFALMFAFEVRTLKRSLFRAILMIAIICVAFAQYAMYHLGAWPRRDLHLCERGLLASQRDSHVPVSAALLEVFRKETRTPSVRRIVALLNQGTLHDELGWQVLRNGLPFFVATPLAWDDAILVREHENGSPSGILNYDYVLDVKNAQDERMSYPWPVNDLSQHWIAGFDLYRENFVRIAQVPVDNHWHIDVYRKRAVVP